MSISYGIDDYFKEYGFRKLRMKDWDERFAPVLIPLFEKHLANHKGTDIGTQFNPITVKDVSLWGLYNDGTLFNYTIPTKIIGIRFDGFEIIYRLGRYYTNCPSKKYDEFLTKMALLLS